MFGKAVADRRIVVTRDYANDTSFTHAEGTDRFVDEVGLCSLVVAPLVAGMEVFGALGHVLAPSRRVHGAPDRARPLALGARGARDGQRPADRGAGPVAAGRRAAGARRTLAARARHADLRRPRPRGGRPVHDRRGPAAARRRRRAHRHRGSGGAPAQGPAGVGRGADPRDRVAQGPRRQARGRRVRPGRRHRRDLHQRRLPHGPEPRPREGSGHVRQVQGHPRRDRDAAPRRPGPVRRDHRLVDAGGRLRARRRDAPRDHRRPVGRRARARTPDRGAGPVTRGAGPARRGGADAARDRRRGSRPSAATRATCCCGSSTRRPVCWAPSAPGSTSSIRCRAPCSGRTRRAARSRMRPSSTPRPTRSRSASPASPSAKAGPLRPATTWPTTGSSTTPRATRACRRWACTR